MSSRVRLTFAVLVSFLCGLSVSIAGRVLADREQGTPAAGTQTTASPALPWADAELLAQVMQRIRENYVSPVDDHKLMLAAIRGMVESLDEHSTFLTRDEFDNMRVSMSGAYAGIGVEVQSGKDGVSVVRRMPGSPAERAGIENGDVIVKIDDVAVDPNNLDAALERMRGPEGSPIRLAVRRAGASELLQFRVERAHVQLASVAAQPLDGDYGYVRIDSFTDTTGNELESAVDRLEHLRAQPLKGIVIDLRDNPGGVLDSAVQIADDFLDHGVIVSADGRTDEARFRMEAKPGDITHGARLVVLVNGGSASASEILAAALHDNGRATLIGRRTYGKGSVQTVMPLGSGQALKLTTSRYFTPAGISINGVGIQPDIVVAGTEQPPAAMDMDITATNANAIAGASRASGKAGLAQRDPQVALALATLSQPTQIARRAESDALAAQR